ncbi:MAG TPA: LLM class F420-dependent oxidoreductase, partial [Rhodospirillaceae bacterium]|nr:LLM class F420-dependent oxidoreductase [Rhodospirillaceae bacterium]
MKFSISLTSGTDRAISAGEITDFAQQAEALDYHAIYITDHYYHNHPNFHSVSAAAVLCAATRRVKLGFSAYQVPLRHPIAVAKKFTMLDALSEGRFIAALATGSYDKEFEAFGIPFNKRGRMMDEGIRAIKRLWTEDSVDFEGDFWSFENVSVKPKPVQKPHLPIWIASSRS